MFQKKSHPVKIKINYHAQVLKNQKKKKSDNWQCDCLEKKRVMLQALLPKKKKKMIMMSLNLRGIYLMYNDIDTVWLADPFSYLKLL